MASSETSSQLLVDDENGALVATDSHPEAEGDNMDTRSDVMDENRQTQLPKVPKCVVALLLGNIFYSFCLLQLSVYVDRYVDCYSCPLDHCPCPSKPPICFPPGWHREYGCHDDSRMDFLDDYWVFVNVVVFLVLPSSVAAMLSGACTKALYRAGLFLRALVSVFLLIIYCFMFVVRCSDMLEHGKLWWFPVVMAWIGFEFWQMRLYFRHWELLCKSDFQEDFPTTFGSSHLETPLLLQGDD